MKGVMISNHILKTTNRNWTSVIVLFVYLKICTMYTYLSTCSEKRRGLLSCQCDMIFVLMK